MDIVLRVMGKTSESYLKEGIEVYLKRLKRYAKYSIQEIPDLKGMKNRNASEQNIAEGQELLKTIGPSDFLVLLDENGKRYSSRGFSEQLQKWMNAGPSTIVFMVGGPFGFSDEVYARANALLSLSDMTFSHQMIRLFFTEQIYRAFTIFKNEPYHHD
ncbi:MAG: 23S rRNA (pseudouridine(1915)-N(3))-methyltransferase RlmH [Bacteroidetes bacterium]|uniref:Ribosomal RNA large subunit methyltransferase H n=1 Tax=Phaeocystidibacter marisrubri TaxID=1577780 RepID=A0A6L3ZHT5_9FLAO|nr:23S rRNA (pseudouridine(1915)-N(3))-methyltransferase RlmH [Phaeocystidibacter marisrubri]KAB2817158.1 23S rRNA (pseudouridine(1915)-N(3))-methyltransferase RlmH [Phaeocystidibacter marisrubri]TNE28756.1 MAG: 23S rRNA (pseudouridine(1915)-N(3))-methyltransferase RlmH [Bacteroidota bacterium]GGH76622.1 ribosomal RNA large subunit methyltransferase H [Phaeocystidibacter marisrubri]